MNITNETKTGDIVTCVLVTGENAVGKYSMTSPVTGSHLIENVELEDGRKADYAWAINELQA